tara:strand:- start:500 stop:646 length:147 start_codon:yes stop_codon:yes gene_type:complete
MDKSSKKIGAKINDKQARSAKALRANLLKRKSQSRSRLEIKNKEKLNG